MSEYKRLTLHNLTSAYDYAKSNLSQEEVEKMYDRLAELEDKIENGRWVELPCNLGENFVIKDYGFNRLRVEQCRIVGYNFSQFESTIYPVDEFEYPYSPEKVFATKEEAEHRLAELKGEK